VENFDYVATIIWGLAAVISVAYLIRRRRRKILD